MNLKINSVYYTKMTLLYVAYYSKVAILNTIFTISKTFNKVNYYAEVYFFDILDNNL